MIKKLIAIFTFTSLYSCRLVAQQANAGKELFYLLDTSKVPKPDRMWTVSEDLPFKIYTLACPCLYKKGKPALILDMRLKGQILGKKELKKMTLLTLPQLIQHSKDILDDGANENVFVIEPYKELYKIYRVKLMNVEKENQYYQHISSR